MIWSKHPRTAKRLLALLLGVVCVAGVWFSSSPFTVAAAGDAKSAGYEAQLKDLKAKEAQIKAEIAALKKDNSKALTLKSTLDTQISLTHEKIETARALIGSLTELVEQKEDEIRQREKDIDTQEEVFCQRMRLAYEDGNVSYVAMLLSSDGLSEFFNNIERVGALLDYDRRVVAKLNTDKAILESDRQSLKETLAIQTEYEATLEADERDLEEQQKENDALLKQIQSNQSGHEKDLAAIQKDRENVDKQLQDYLKQLQETENKSYMVEGQLQWPVKAADSAKYDYISSKFGMRNLYVGSANVSNHKGIDVAVSYVPLYACGAGTVVTSAYSSSYGYYIVIDHGGGVSTLYAHLSKLAVSKGQNVKAGTKIGTSGCSGYATGPHLHLEIRLNGTAVDPLTAKDKAGKYYLSRPSSLRYAKDA